jgi:hypothetical protein
MLDYTSIMVLAYCRATGKTIAETLADLEVDHLIDPAEIGQPSPEEELLISSLEYDKKGVTDWAKSYRENCP